ncbi:MAG: hypothetical protein PHU81_04520 [Acidobacteriota bacterium]|nr:hypothetical protein [Acidobacteriota bacterium]
MSQQPAGTTWASLRSHELEEKITRRFVPAVLILCVLFALFLFITRPIPHGHHYDLALKLSLELFLIWCLYSLSPRYLNHRLLLSLILIAGLGLGYYQLFLPKNAPEVTETYKSVFQDLEEGRNPYVSGRIYHRNENDEVVYQNFNYPPLELYPYWLFYRLFKVWDASSLGLFLIFIQLLSAVILVLTFRRVCPWYLLAFLPLLVFSEVIVTPAMNMLLVSIFMSLLYRQKKKPTTANRLLLALVIGLGLDAKFFFIPLAATYFYWRLEFKDYKSWLKIGAEGLLSLSVALVLMLPFGPLNVIKNTIFFNLNLGERNIYTTFFPNILSGFFYLIGQPGLYPAGAILILLLVILFSRKISLCSALLLSSLTFLLVAPTPETQYFGTLLLLSLAAKMIKISAEPALAENRIR